MEINNCPHCGGKAEIKYNMSYGHGDSGYEDLRVKCSKCTLSLGDGYNYDEPSEESKIKVITNWNNLKLNALG